MKQESDMILQDAMAGGKYFIRSVQTDLGVFGNRTDVIVVGETTLGGASHLTLPSNAILIDRDGQVAVGDLDLLDSYES